MSKITQVRTWDDVGFTDNCIEIPVIGKTLPTPTNTYTGPFTPSKDREFSCIQLPVPYMELINTSYIELTYDLNNATNDLVLYGWVDRVDMRSDTDDYPKTDVYYHIDYWRTYNASATFGSGIVRRRPKVTNDTLPPQPYSHRFYKLQEPVTVIPENVFWVIVNLVKNVEGGTSEDPTIYSEFETRAYPISKDNSSRYVGTGSGYLVPTFQQTIAGRWDELWGIDPASIASAFIAPIPPAETTGSGTQSSPVTCKGWTARKDEGASCGYLYFNNASSYGPSYPIFASLDTPVLADDKHRYVFIGFDGEVLGEFPWGIQMEEYSYRLVIGATSCYIQFRFGDWLTIGVQANIDAHANGTCFTIPCVALDVTSNTWSSYVYGGQRQYDMQAKQFEADRAFQAGQMDVVTNAILGGMGGATAVGSSFAGLLGGGVAGQALGAAVSTAATEVALAADYAYTTGVYNDQMQKLDDYKAAVQTNGLLTPGTGWDSVFYGIVPAIMRMDIDDYSADQMDNDIALYGAHVSEPKASCQSLVSAGGPLQITNLVVGGNIPSVAKTYIKAKFDSGVRLI